MSNNISPETKKTTRRRGMITAGAVVLIVLAVVVINLIVGQLPTHVTGIDISPQKITEISDVSKEIARSLDKDVELLLVSDSADIDKRITNFVYKYASLSDHISVQKIDSVKDPSVLEEYDIETNSLVVRSPETEKFTSLTFSGFTNSLIEYDYDINSIMGSFLNYESKFNADKAITTAINYVANEAKHTAYFTTGHEEGTTPEGIINLMDMANVTVSHTKITLTDGIPDDCDLLICYDPLNDLTVDEVKVITSYMVSGRDFMLVINHDNLSNFNSLMQVYGFNMQTGYVGDTERYYPQYVSTYGQLCFKPIIVDLPDMPEEAIVVDASAILLCAPVRSTIRDSIRLMTSTGGVLFTEQGYGEDFKEYIIGADAYDQENGSRFTVVTSAAIFADSITQSFTTLANLDIFDALMKNNFEDMQDLSDIHAKDIKQNYNTIQNRLIPGLVFIAVIPICCIVGGLVYWTKRRKS